MKTRRRMPVIDDPKAQVAVRHLVFEPTNLFYDESCVWRWLSQLLARFDIHTPFDAFYCLWRHDYLPLVGDDLVSCREVFDTFLSDMGLRLGQRHEIAAAFLPRWQCVVRHPRALPRIHATLNQLSRMGIELAVWHRHGVCLCDTARQLAALGLGSMLRIIPTDPHDAHLTRATLRRVEQFLSGVGDEIGLISSDRWTTKLGRQLGWQAIDCHGSATVEDDSHAIRLEQLTSLIVPDGHRIARAA